MDGAWDEGGGGPAGESARSGTDAPDEGGPRMGSAPAGTGAPGEGGSRGGSAGTGSTDEGGSRGGSTPAGTGATDEGGTRGGSAPTGVGATAVGVARLRAAESRRPDRLFDDPYASAFVAAAGLPAVAGIPRPPGQAGGAWGSLARYVAVRTRFFDDWALAACAAGCRQVVLLGAGLDTRAFRLAWPAGVSLFELDLPGVLAFKEEVLARKDARPACRRIVVPVDLLAGWPGALTAAGFLPGRPCAWLAEGLLVYLSLDDSERLLGRVGALSAPGSRLALAHMSKAMLDDLSALPGAAGAQARPFRALWRSAMPEDPAGWLARLGWRADVHDVAERAASYGRPVAAPAGATAPRALLISAERHAERPA